MDCHDRYWDGSGRLPRGLLEEAKPRDAAGTGGGAVGRRAHADGTAGPGGARACTITRVDTGDSGQSASQRDSEQWQRDHVGERGLGAPATLMAARSLWSSGGVSVRGPRPTPARETLIYTKQEIYAAGC